MGLENIIKEKVISFRKLWANINKDNRHLTTEMIEDLLKASLTQAFIEGGKAERELKVSEMGFYDLVEIAKALLETNYPLDLFDGSSGDPGPRFTAKLHEVLSLINK